MKPTKISCIHYLSIYIVLIIGVCSNILLEKIFQYIAKIFYIIFKTQKYLNIIAKLLPYMHTAILVVRNKSHTKRINFYESVTQYGCDGQFFYDIYNFI